MVVVSEERHSISMAIDGTLYGPLRPEEVRRIVARFSRQKGTGETGLSSERRRGFSVAQDRELNDPGCRLRIHLTTCASRRYNGRDSGDRMRSYRADIAQHSLPVVACNTLIIGSGAASLNAAVHLYDNG